MRIKKGFEKELQEPRNGNLYILKDGSYNIMPPSCRMQDNENMDNVIQSFGECVFKLKEVKIIIQELQKI